MRARCSHAITPRDGPAPPSPPGRMGWLQSPDRQALFVCCGSCSDCDDAELEAKILAQFSDTAPTAVAGGQRIPVRDQGPSHFGSYGGAG